MSRALLILKFLKTLIKLFRILSISKLLVLVASNIKREKIVLEIIIFFINFCFLLIIFIKSLILILITF